MSAYYVVGYNQLPFTVRLDRSPRPVTPAEDRFARHVETIEVDGQLHRVWNGGDSFNMGDGRIVTPKRAALELLGVELPLHCRALALCNIPGCLALCCMAIKV